VRGTSSRRAPALTRAERGRLAFLTSTHVVDDLYQGAVPALLPFLALERHYSYAGLAGIVLAATLLGSVAAPDVAVLFITAFGLGIVLFAPFAVQVTLGQDFLPNRIGVASGVTLGLAASVGGIAAPLFGLVADSYGLPTALCAIAAFPAVACALTFMLRDPRPRSEGGHPGQESASM
jgi:MFS family permease